MSAESDLSSKQWAKPTSLDSATAPASGEIFYLFRDESGASHIVSSLDEVPADHRSAATRWVLDSGWQGSVETEAPTVAQQTSVPAHIQPNPMQVHPPSLLLGLAMTLMLAVAFRTWRSGGPRVLSRMTIVVLITAVVMGLYSLWMRQGVRTAGPANVQSGAQMVQEAQKSAESIRQSTQRKQRDLNDINNDSGSE